MQSMKRPFYVFGTLILLSLLCTVRPSLSAVVISEFMAENDGFLFDEDGESPDWIEIHNDTAGAVDLGGWHLTDSPTNLTAWTFPATNLPAGAYMLVFASGKDRAIPGRPLHTNFRLENSGEYLALVQPDGVTVAHHFSPTYPPQRANVSFGTERTVTTIPLVLTGATARMHIPTDGSLGAAWTAADFDDSAWLSGPTGTGFETATAGGTNASGVVLSVDFNDDDSGEAGAANTETGFSTMTLSANPSTFNGISVTLSALGGATLDDRDRAVPTDSPPNFTQDQLYDDFIFAVGQTNGNGMRVRLTGLPPDNDYFVTIWSYDNSSLGTRVSDWIENGSGTTNIIVNGYNFDGAVLPTTNGQHTFIGPVRSSSAGVLQIEGRRSGGTSHGVFLNALQLVSLSYRSIIATDIGAQMSNQNATAFIRIPFNVTDLSAFQTLNLGVKYDDGFFAYINSQPVASRNAPGSAEWNASATAAHPGAQAIVFEEISIPNAPGLIANGSNTLAIHGLNLSPTDGDFLIIPELRGIDVDVIPDRYLTPPTPGRANGPGYAGFVADTKFSVDRGFYDAPFNLEITCDTPGAEIRWTANGSIPTLLNGFVYSGPILITNNSFIRAAAFAPGLIPSDVDTHSYIFIRDVLQQSAVQPGYPTTWQASYPADYGMDSNIVNHPTYGATISNDLRSIPSLCIVSDHTGLWSSSTGIYPNSTARGPAWERATSAELIAGDGSTQFATTCQIELHGNASRDNVRTPKHSMRLSFTSDFGPTKLRYDWFGGDVDVHNTIVLRSCGFVDGWAGRYADPDLHTSTETGETFRGTRYRPENTCYVRDVWVKESFRDMGWSASRSAYVHLYINGLYWGLYQPSERLEASYFSLLYGGEERAWDVVVGEDNDGPPVIVDGSGVDWTNVLNIVNRGITNEIAYQAVAQLVDIDNLIDYMMVHIFAESEDWPRHNWYVARRRETNGVPGTKFICSVWDQELTLDRLVRRNRISVGNTGGEIYGPGRVYAQLRNWGEFRRQFGDRVHKHLFNSGALTPSNNVARLLAEAGIIRDAVVGESARWGDARKDPVPPTTPPQVGTGKTFTRDEWWQPEIDKLATNFLRTLTATNVARFRAGGLYPIMGAPLFSQFGGAVPAGFTLTMSHTNPAGTIFYTVDGTDPRVYGTGAVGPGAQAYSAPIPINTPTLVRARVLNGITWSALTETVFYPPQDLSKLFLTEIMYHPPDSGTTNAEEFEFIELKNTDTNSLNLSGLRFANGISFVFSNGTVLAPGEFFVLVRNATAFTARYPSVAYHGIYTGRLANEGETVTLAHPLGQNIFSVNYGDASPWPVTPDGLGFSLVQREPILTQAPDNGIRWRASAFAGGSPGADDPQVAIAPVVINEVLTASVPPDVDRIELFNPTTTNVDIGGWFLTDANAFPKKFRIADGTIVAPGAFMVFTEAHFNPMPAGPNNFSLSSRGEQIYLLSGDANTNLTGYSHGFNFGAADPGVTFGRYLNSIGEEHFPSQVAVTFEGTNSGPIIGPVVINEIHYHPAPGSDEFIELKNISASAVQLFDATYPSNTWRLNGVGFLFPSNLTIVADGYLLLVATNPAAFRTKHSVPAEVGIIGPYAGALQDSGERLKLERPAPPDTNGPAFIVMDEVRYNDRAPWSAAADGAGPSLQRKEAMEFGDDPINWDSAVPTPGQANTTKDSDGDGMPDSWEMANGTQVGIADADADPDNDGRTNLEEYIAGTHPGEASSEFTVEISLNPGPEITFNSVVGRRYTLEYSEQLPPVWIEAQSSINGTGSPITLQATNSAGGFYRISVRRP